MNSTSTSTNKFEQLADLKQKSIIDASVNEFANNGFKNASVNKIVEKAGISKGSLFNYFKSKNLLFDHIYQIALHEVKSYLAKVRDESENDDFFTRFSKIINAGIVFINKHPRLARIYFRLLNSDDSPHGKEIIQNLHNEAIRYLTYFVEKGIERKELRSELNPPTVAFLMEGVLNRILQVHYLEIFDAKSDISKNDNNWIDEIVDTLKTGLSTVSPK
ncbi:MAG: TetR/AcrR family transcriptional regulator [Candidatus Marinimicrobia bacterium]|nr:TetR/AcrR family transcriptional regulator [Candidatus Neomarinimicrobiota bacterium]